MESTRASAPLCAVAGAATSTSADAARRAAALGRTWRIRMDGGGVAVRSWSGDHRLLRSTRQMDSPMPKTVALQTGPRVLIRAPAPDDEAELTSLVRASRRFHAGWI